STNSQSGDYTYDTNGNMNYDPFKKMNVTYNYLNLPRKITIDDCKFIELLYDASGNKLRKTIKEGAMTLRTQDYVGGIEYTNNQLEAIYHSEGRVYYEGTTSRYEYNITDHLGNVRLTFTDKGGDGFVDMTNDPNTNDVLSESHYYPFGMQMQGPWISNQGRATDYRYNGKELNRDFGLNWHDYGARWYDASIGRFGVIDRFAEKYYHMSGYGYAAGNPIKYIDVNGDSLNISHLQRNNPSAFYNFKDQVEAITGFTLDVDDKGNVTINQAAGVKKDANGKDIGSKTARKMLIKAISSESMVTIEDNPGGKSRVWLDDDGNYTNEIKLDVLEINSSKPSKNLNPLTNGIGMIFFHELGHTPVGGGRHDPVGIGTDGDYDPGPNVRRINKIRKELGPSFGKRMVYNFKALVDEKKQRVLLYDAYSKTALKALRQGKAPNKNDLFYLTIIE
ncbi:MAG: RHS repeat-associated core domain-containing protein, partial [Bacteroidota bacterium]